MPHFAEEKRTTISLDFSVAEAQEILALAREHGSSMLEKKLVRQLEDQDYFSFTRDKKMTYSSFRNIKMVEEIVALYPHKEGEGQSVIHTTLQGKELFTGVSPKTPSTWLLENLAINKQTPLISEKSRSEGLIRPILLEMLRENLGEFTLFSGEIFHVDESFGLTGECDFLLSLSPETDFIQTPVFALVEAKKKSVEEGLGQCAAQMIAARELNTREGKVLPAIFGSVSTGEIWRFMKLEGNTLTIDKGRYYEKFELNKILGILDYIVNCY